MKPANRIDAEHYDIFISYSRSDISFARRLEKALKAYKPPKDLDVPQRRLRVFRDEGNFTGTEYFKSIEHFLKNSGKLLMVCSAAARRSDYVDDEIRRFVEAHGAENVVLVLAAGIPNNKGGRRREGACPGGGQR